MVNISFAPGLVPVLKHQSGKHDQKTHGRWSVGQEGGSGLSHKEMFDLNQTGYDPLVKKVYAAESKNSPLFVLNTENPMPEAPSRSNYGIEGEEYEEAYKQYSKDFRNWQMDVTESVISPIGKKHLVGTPNGVKKYVTEVLEEDWFVESFGDGGSAGPPKVSVTYNRKGEAGSYAMGFKNNEPVSTLTINRSYSKSEPVIVHEISHYATVISATTKTESHGVEFAKNHVFIADKIMGKSFADGLEKAYIEEGVPLEN